MYFALSEMLSIATTLWIANTTLKLKPLKKKGVVTGAKGGSYWCKKKIKASVYAGLRGVEKSSTISTISTISQPAPL